MIYNQTYPSFWSTHTIKINNFNIYQQLISITSLSLPFIIIYNIYITFRDTISFPNSFYYSQIRQNPFSFIHILFSSISITFSIFINYNTSYYHTWYSTPQLLFTPYQNDHIHVCNHIIIVSKVYLESRARNVEGANHGNHYFMNTIWRPSTSYFKVMTLRSRLVFSCKIGHLES